MRSPVSRAVRWISALALAVVVAVAVINSGSASEPGAATPDPSLAGGTSQTEFGPLSPSDADLLVKVRQAGLWETPTGQQMQQRATSEVVQEVGRLIAAEHTELDSIVRDTADQLGVSLPSQPSAQQQAWMAEISEQAAADYDRVAVNRLRAAHGKVLPIIAEVRSGTRNELVREFATTAATFVNRHHEYLESTGMVDFAALPEPAGPSPAPPSSTSAATVSPVLTVGGSDSGDDTGPLAAVLNAVRESSMSSFLAALVAFIAVIGAGALLDLMVRGPSRDASRGPRPPVGPPVGGYPAPRPVPNRPTRRPPPPRRHAPNGHGRPPRRGRVPTAFGVALLAALLVPPMLYGSGSPPTDPPASPAAAAGFAALDRGALAPAAGAPAAFTLTSSNSDDGEEGRDKDPGKDENTRDDASDGDKDDGDKNKNKNEENNNQDEDEEFPGRDEAAPPARDDFVDITTVRPNRDEPRPSSDASTGSFISDCGSPNRALRNSDNWIVAPDKVNGAQHQHDYVGNVSTDAFTSEEDLVQSDTTCALNDRSTYFWPAIRDTSRVGADENAAGGGLDGNFGEILRPARAVMQFMGNPRGPVEAMPPLLRAITGDAKAVTNGDADARAQWTCLGFENRFTTQYPLCPAGSRLLRVLDFPSCWDGRDVDSENHRAHIAFPDEDGSCPSDTTAVPQLRMILAYDQPRGRNFALDGFPDQRHDPTTDHADFTNVMPDQLMAAVVKCINSGRQC